MNNKSKKVLTWTLILTVLVGILYLMFKDNYKEILSTIKNTKLRFIFMIILLGYIYQVLDAMPCWLLIKQYIKGFPLIRAVQVVYLGVFMSTATLGAGIAPAQAYFLHKQGLPAGRGISLMTMPYIFHKTVIMLYSLIVLLLFGRGLSTYIDIPIYYVIAGYGVSVAIVLGLLIVCTLKPLINLLIGLVNKIKIPSKWTSKKDAVIAQMLALNEQSKEILTYKGLCLKICLIDFVKMTVLYLIPYICFMGVSGEVGYSIFTVVLLSSIMRLLIDVAPNVGGIGPTEIAFTLIFMGMFGEIEAAAAMVLYRLATYYIPFLTSAIITVYIKKKSLL